MTAQAHKHITTDDDLYRHSSQYRLWSFSKDQLKERKSHAYERAVRSVQIKLLQGPSESEKSEKSADSAEPVEQRTPLTLDEHTQLVNFYASKVTDIAKTFRMPSQVRATAIAYFKRFYLQTNVMEHHPKNVLYTAIFLASKAENYFITIEKFCEPLPRTVPEDILNMEFLVLQTLSFTLNVQNPLGPLHGFFLDTLQELKDYEHSDSSLGAIYDKSRQIIMDSMLTDAMFLYTPPQIALSALYHVDKDLATKYLQKKYASNESKLEHLMSIIVSCHQVLINVNVPSSEIGKSIDKKLHLLLKQEGSKKRVSSEQENVDSNHKKLRLDE